MQINNRKQKGTAETAVMPRMAILFKEKTYFISLLIRSNVHNTVPLLSKRKTSSCQEMDFYFTLDFSDTEFSFIYSYVSHP